MAEVTINYKAAAIATMDASGTKTLQTQGKYCEDDIEVVYARPSGGGGFSAADILIGDAPSGEVSLIATKSIPTRGVSGRQALTKLTIDLQQGYILGGYAIATNPALETVVLINPSTNPGLGSTRHGSYAITDNANLLCIVSRGCSRAYNTSGMRANSKLQVVDFEFLTHPQGVATISSSMFLGDTQLTALILRQNDVVPLSGVDAFNNSPFASGKSGGTLFVPQAKITEYTQATNWSTILGYANNSIQAIEGSIYENAYADGTPIT